MTTLRINTLPELMYAVAAALDNRDLAALDAAERQTRDWLVGSAERNAIGCLVEAARGAIYDME